MYLSRSFARCFKLSWLWPIATTSSHAHPTRLLVDWVVLSHSNSTWCLYRLLITGILTTVITEIWIYACCVWPGQYMEAKHSQTHPGQWYSNALATNHGQAINKSVSIQFQQHTVLGHWTRTVTHIQSSHYLWKSLPGREVANWWLVCMTIREPICLKLLYNVLDLLFISQRGSCSNFFFFFFFFFFESFNDKTVNCLGRETLACKFTGGPTMPLLL